MTERILVPIDGSEQSFKALDIAISLSHLEDSEIVLLHVKPEHELPVGLSEWARTQRIFDEPERACGSAVADAVLASAKARLDGNIKVSQRVEYGNPAERILAVANGDGASIIVMGTRGLTGFKGFVMGSVARRVTLEAKCPVISVKS